MLMDTRLFFTARSVGQLRKGKPHYRNRILFGEGIEHVYDVPA